MPFDFHLDYSSFTTLGLVGFGLILGLKFLRAYHDKSKLAHIPTLGLDGIFTSYITVYKIFTGATDFIEEGYRLYPGGKFKIPTIDGWWVVVNGTNLIDDIRKATDEELSNLEPLKDLLSARYTIHPNSLINPYHIDVIRSPLTRNIGAGFADIHDEVKAAFADRIPVTDDWTEICAKDAVVDIVVRAVNRFFVGLPLCRDPDYCRLNIKFAVDVFFSSLIINLFPRYLHPIVGRIFSGRKSALRRVMRHLKPVIEERLRMQKQNGKDWFDKPNDFIQWSMDAEQYAPVSQRTSIEDLCVRTLFLNFASIHTTSDTFTSALYQLAAHPEYAEPLRKEVESVIEKEGWTKIAMVQMRLLDSFLKESARLNGTNALGLARKAMKDFTFSDGTTIPAGSWVTTAAWPISRDETYFPGGSEFRPFRFAELRDKDGKESVKHQFTKTELEWTVFGLGRHACPGRFFASTEMKAFMAHILLNYDVKLPGDSKEVPPLLRFNFVVGANRNAKVLFRKRRME